MEQTKEQLNRKIVTIKKYFCHEQHRKDRELSNEYWGFQQLNASPEISFSILKKRPPTRRKRACTYVYIKNFS